VKLQTEGFNPNEATLMELGPSEAHAPISFMYILPTSTRTALVEHTSFSMRPQEEGVHLSECHRWLSRNGFGGALVEEAEWGAIPMGLQPSRRRLGELRVGSIGGAVRAATGYAFLSIHQQAEVLAERVCGCLAAGGSNSVRGWHPIPLWMRFTDRLFLRSLAGAPQQGSLILERLLKKAPEEELVAFLGGSATLVQALSVVRCVPKGRMLRSLLGW
jgi:lycopene beta-cyclase